MRTNPPISDSEWMDTIRGLKAGEPAVLQCLYAKLGPMLQAIAARRVAPHLQSRFDAEDVVQSTFRTFFRRAQGGQFQFEDNQRLWNLLCAITLTKLKEKVRFHERQSRAASREQSDVDSQRSGQPRTPPISAVISPDAALEFADEFDHLLAALAPPERRLVELKLQDRTNDEAAEALGVSERTIRRMLAELQAKFERQLGAT
jgi:RNA polymerase sigma-70 factor (ECF subfamily)